MTQTMTESEQLFREVADLIRGYREKCGLSQGGLAEALGVASQRVNALESGRSRPSLNTLLRLSEALDVPVSALIPAAFSGPRPRVPARKK